MTSGLLRGAGFPRLLSFLIAALAAATPGSAGQVEVSGSIGSTPYVDRQSTAYRLAAPPVPSTLVSFDTSAPIDVRTDGGLVVGGGVGWLVHPNVSIEGRVDAVTLNVDSTPLVFHSNVTLPGGVLGTTQEVSVGPAQLSYHHPIIASAGVRFRGHVGSTRFGWTAGGGLSFLTGTELVASNPINVGSLALNGRPLPLPVSLQVGDVELRGRTPARAGAHVTAGIDIPLWSRLHLRPEVRYIRLQQMRLDWTDVTARTPLGPLGATVGEPLTGLTPMELQSSFLLLQTAMVFRF